MMAYLFGVWFSNTHSWSPLPYPWMRMGPFVFVCSVSQDVERDASTCMASYAKIARIDHSSEPAMTDQHQVF